jgi:hypothetical protein
MRCHHLLWLLPVFTLSYASSLVSPPLPTGVRALAVLPPNNRTGESLFVGGTSLVVNPPATATCIDARHGHPRRCRPDRRPSGCPRAVCVVKTRTVLTSTQLTLSIIDLYVIGGQVSLREP